MRDLTAGLNAYRVLSTALAPLVPMLLRQRLLQGKEDPARLKERLGYASAARPEGTLIWIHGASVGESMAALPLIDALLARTQAHILVTSSTVTSAAVMAARLPQGVIHQFGIIDTPGAARRFISHWRPQIGLFIDSEIWPNMIVEARRRGVKLALINGRMSERSFAGWSRAKKSAAALLSAYDLCLAQDDRSAERLTALGAGRVEITGSLKADAPPLPADAAAFDALRAVIGARPVFLAAQTHPGEDETVLPVHDRLRQTFPDLLTVIVPRHPERGEEIAMLCGTRRIATRSRGEAITPEIAIYIADTIGELGLFYRLARAAFVGGSLIAHGGQNPLEPARLKCAVFAGPHTENFIDAYDAIFAAQGEGRIADSAALCGALAPLLADAGAAAALGRKAETGALTLSGAVAHTCAAVERMLGHAPA